MAPQRIERLQRKAQRIENWKQEVTDMLNTGYVNQELYRRGWRGVSELSGMQL